MGALETEVVSLRNGIPVFLVRFSGRKRKSGREPIFFCVCNISMPGTLHIETCLTLLIMLGKEVYFSPFWR